MRVLKLLLFLFICPVFLFGNEYGLIKSVGEYGQNPKRVFVYPGEAEAEAEGLAAFCEIDSIVFCLDPDTLMFDSGGDTCSDGENVASCSSRVTPASFNWVQATDGDRPSWNASVVAANNKPTLTFSGGTEMLDEGVANMLNNQMNSGYTLFFVGQTPDGDPASTNVFVEQHDGAQENNYFGILQQSIGAGQLSLRMEINNVLYSVIVTTITTPAWHGNGDTGFYIATMRCNPSGYLTGYFNGAPVDSVDISGVTASYNAITSISHAERGYIGDKIVTTTPVGTEFYGDLAMYALFNDDIPYADVQTAHNLLSEYFSITLAFDNEGKTIYVVSLEHPNYTQYREEYEAGNTALYNIINQ